MSDAGLHAVSVDEYVRQFVRKITEGEKYSAPEELDKTSRSLHALLRRLAQDGDREDVRLAFKTLKHEFGVQWRRTSMACRDQVASRLFTIMDVIHKECLKTMRPEADSSPINTVILEEFRLRIAKMVTGETWEDLVPLRFSALKRMYEYSQKENDVRRQTSSGSYTGRPHERVNSGKLTVSKLLRSVTGSPVMGSWSAVFDELFLTSGAKLAPLLRALLEENAAMAEDLKTLKKPTGSGDSKPNSIKPVKVKNGKVSAKGKECSLQAEPVVAAVCDAKTEQQLHSSNNSKELHPLRRLSLASGNLIDLGDAVLSPKMLSELEPRPPLEDRSLLTNPAPMPRAVLSEPLLSSTPQSHEWVAFADNTPDVRAKEAIQDKQQQLLSPRVSSNGSVCDTSSNGTVPKHLQAQVDPGFPVSNGDIHSNVGVMQPTPFDSGLPLASGPFNRSSAAANGLNGMRRHQVLPTSTAMVAYQSKVAISKSPRPSGCDVHPLESLDPLKRHT